MFFYFLYRATKELYEDLSDIFSGDMNNKAFRELLVMVRFSHSTDIHADIQLWRNVKSSSLYLAQNLSNIYWSTEITI